MSYLYTSTAIEQHTLFKSIYVIAKKTLRGQITNPRDLLMSSLLIIVSVSSTEKHVRIEATVNQRAFTCSQTRGQLKAYRNGNGVIPDRPGGTGQTCF